MYTTGVMPNFFTKTGRMHTIGHFTPTGFKGLGFKVYAKELAP